MPPRSLADTGESRDPAGSSGAAVVEEAQRGGCSAPLAVYLVAAVGSGIGLLGKGALLEKVTSGPRPLVVAAVLFGLGTPFLWKRAIEHRHWIAPAGMAALLVAFFVVFPRIQAMHAQGRGSDQADCVIVAGARIAGGLWPYDSAALWSGHPMSCGPGWVVLQAPVVQSVGYAASLFAWWVGCVLSLAASIGRERTLALLSLAWLSPGVWLCASNGTDFLTFGIAAAASVAFAECGGTSWAFVLVLGLLSQFRLPTLLFPIALAGSIGRARAIAAAGLAIATYAALLAWNADGFIREGPLAVLLKLVDLEMFPLLRRPALAFTAFTIAGATGIAMLAKTGVHLPQAWRPLTYLAVVLLAPALLDLAQKLQTFGFALQALEFWEGGPWIVACLPLAGMRLLGARADLAPQPAARSSIGGP